MEKIIELDPTILGDFWGVGQENLAALAQFFPHAKLTARGNLFKIQADPETVNRITQVLAALLHHYQQHPPLSEAIVAYYVNNPTPLTLPVSHQHTILYTHSGKPIKPKTRNQHAVVTAVQKHDLTFIAGSAGTGKTYLAVALAIQALKKKEVAKIIITRPIVKTAPYLLPIYDTLDEILSIEKRKYYQETGIIEVSPLAYMRGRTFHHAFVILDEAQNTTTKQMKMFLTRMGLQAKFVITGDTTQIDLPPRKQSGLLEAIRILQSVEGIACTYLTEHDIVRHALVKDIIQAYEDNRHA
jgi:phosphate starvation-inducible protein PhoH and related proteins